MAVAADRPAIVSADGPSGGSAGIAPIPRNPQAAERLGLTEAEYEARLARNMADMPENERLNLAAQAVGRPLTEAQNRAVLLAHETGVLGPEGTFSRADLLAKARILREAGFSREEIQALMDNGITGRRMLAGSGNATLSVTEAERLLTQAGLSPDQITRFRQNLGYRRDNLSGAEITEVWSTINGKGVAALKSGRTAEASRHFAQGEEALNALLQRNLAEGRDTSPIIARLFAHRDLGAVSGGRIPDGDQLFDQAVRAGYFDSRFSGDRSLQDFYDPRARGNPDRYSALAVGRGQDPYLVYAAANRQYQELLAIRAYLIQPAYQRTVDMPAWLQGVNERQLSEWMQDYRRSMEQIQREHFRGS